MKMNRCRRKIHEFRVFTVWMSEKTAGLHWRLPGGELQFKNDAFLSLDVSGFYTYFDNQILPDYDTRNDAIIYNNLEGYANPYLTNRTGYVKDGEQLYDRLVESYRDGKVSPAPEFVALRYREYIFPKHRWVGLKEVRERIHYFETNRELQVFRAGDLRTVWKDASHKRIRPMSSINSLGYRLTLNQHLYYEQSDSVWVMDDYSFQPVNDETGKLLYTDDGKAVWWSVLGDHGEWRGRGRRLVL